MLDVQSASVVLLVLKITLLPLTSEPALTPSNPPDCARTPSAMPSISLNFKSVTKSTVCTTGIVIYESCAVRKGTAKVTVPTSSPLLVTPSTTRLSADTFRPGSV